MEIRPKQIGGSVYQIPIEVTLKRWVLKGARNKKG